MATIRKVSADMCLRMMAIFIRHPHPPAGGHVRGEYRSSAYSFRTSEEVTVRRDCLTGRQILYNLSYLNHHSLKFCQSN